VNSLSQEHVDKYSHNCHVDANCTNTKGSFYCTCHTGYSGDGVTCIGTNYVFTITYKVMITVCCYENDDTWRHSIKQMKVNFYFMNTYPSFFPSWINVKRCVVKPFPVYLSLSDIDECFPDQISNEYHNLAHNCHADANCTNTKGSFYCTCLNGYSGDGVTCVGEFSQWRMVNEANDRTLIWII